MPHLLPVSEIFFSIQGEGPGVGEPTVFVRLFGCPRRCKWCDSMHAVEGKNFQKLPFEYIAELAGSRPNFHNVCFTGGEPGIYTALLAMLIDQHFQNFRVRSVETAVSDPSVFADCDLTRIVWSPKMPSSGEPTPETPGIDPGIVQNIAIKLVITDAGDYQAALVFLYNLRKSNPKTLPTEIFLQPAFGTPLKFVLDSWCQFGAAGFDVRVIPQVHKLVGLQ